MFRLTREVRFSINRDADAQSQGGNSYAGIPATAGLSPFFTLRVTLSGQLDPATNYLRNIKDIDKEVRSRAIGIVRDWSYSATGTPPRPAAGVLPALWKELAGAWPGTTLEQLELSLTPFLSLSISASEPEMIRLSQKFEFSASHRLHNPVLSEEQNRQAYGKCNNAHGHGHNYEVQVTLAAPQANHNGLLVGLPAFERIVAETVIDRFDHKNLNIEVPEFARLIPSVENIAKVIYTLLKPRFFEQSAKLASVTVWETPKTWCEYSE